MPKKRRLTEVELSTLRPLEQELRAAAMRGDFQKATALTKKIQPLLREAGDETRLQKNKAWLFEAALEAGEASYAYRGFLGIRAKMRPTTRIYLEATALLAICHLRRGDLEEAKPVVREAFARVPNIKSVRRQRQFYRRLVNRFEEEWALSVLRAEGLEKLDPATVQDEAGRLVATKPEDELLLQLADSVPQHRVDLLFAIYEFSRKQLPAPERLLLPSPEEKRKRREIGRTVFRAAERAVWKALCDSESDTYKMWFHHGLMVAMDKRLVGASIVTALTGIGLGAYAIAVPLTALLIKLGVDVFCETHKPDGLMIGLSE